MCGFVSLYVWCFLLPPPPPPAQLEFFGNADRICSFRFSNVLIYILEVSRFCKNFPRRFVRSGVMAAVLKFDLAFILPTE